MSEQESIRLRLFGLRSTRMNRMEREAFPCNPGLTIGQVWSELQSSAQPGSPLASLQRDMVLALVNGAPIQQLAGWETTLAAGDTVTFMLKAFGG